MDWGNLLFSFQGRINRAKFWLAVLVYILASIVAGIIGFASGSDALAMLLNSIVSLVSFVSGIFVAIKRLHDRDKSGWWRGSLELPKNHRVRAASGCCFRSPVSRSRSGPSSSLAVCAEPSVRTATVSIRSPPRPQRRRNDVRAWTSKAGRMTSPADPVAIARDLVRCPSVTPAEGGALAYLEGLLKAAGFMVHRPKFNEPGTAEVENFYARIGTEQPHLVFAGHTDVVPPGDQTAWTHAPFAGEIADNVLYGRGAVDMKGGIACFVAAALDYLASIGGRPNGSLSFFITGDEEDVVVNGTVKLLQWAAGRGETFDHCILGEPTNPQVLGDAIKIGRRGSLNGTLIVAGKQGHVAYPQLADNPIRKLVTIMAAMMAKPLDRG